MIAAVLLLFGWVMSYRKIPNQWNHKIFKLGNVSGKQIEEEERRSLKKEQESQLKKPFLQCFG